MSKSKGECLRDSIDRRHDGWAYVSEQGLDYFDGYASSIFKAMDEFAKQECIELINFLMGDERLMEDEGDANSVYQFFLQSKQI